MKCIALNITKSFGSVITDKDTRKCKYIHVRQNIYNTETLKKQKLRPPLFV